MNQLSWKYLAILLAISLAACSSAPTLSQPTGAPQDKPTDTSSTGTSGQLLSSSKPRAAQIALDPGDLQTLTAGNTRFALDLYQTLREQDGNLFFSPYSISLALAMTEGGARGQTREEMERVLHFDLPQERLHPTLNALEQTLNELGKQTQSFTEEGAPTATEPPGFFLNIANSIWGQKDYPFETTYLDMLAENYGAGMRLWDFANDPENGRAAINQWVRDETRGKIEDLIPAGAIDPLTRLVLANAIYYKAAWLHPFEPAATSKAPFHRLDGSTSDVDLMNQSELLAYTKGDGWQAVELPYISASYRMVVLVPNEGRFEDFESSLDAARLEEILGAMQSSQVNLGFPKFANESSFSLVDALAKLGMQKAFRAGEADFSGMTGNQDLNIGDVVHKAYIQVDEEGTEAAAATAVIMVAAGAPGEPVNLTIDRPFIYLIHERQTGTVLFMGRVLKP